MEECADMVMPVSGPVGLGTAAACSFRASLIFGFTDTFQVKLQILRVPIPSQFMRMAPYLITMIVLAGVVGRAAPPAAAGQPYERQ